MMRDIYSAKYLNLLCLLSSFECMAGSMGAMGGNIKRTKLHKTLVIA